jgi:FG-GAP-like repeat/Secretion system C-terminal sorting domain
LQYELADICWGKIFENGLERCRSRLSPSPDECATPFTSGEVEDRDGAAHPGATVLTFDRDNDGDKDLILGNISYDCLNYMLNGGTPQNAWMVEQDTTFPKEDVPVDLLSFPAAYFLDINNDDVKDLIVAPNSPSINEDRANVWWYKTVQNGNITDFKLESKKLFTSEMIDLGTATHPAFADVNGDDLLDMVVGNYGYYTPAGPDQPAVYTNTRLYLYLNTGTFAAPEFILQDTDWLGMSEFAPNEYDLAPAFGDLDGDGDLDLVVGNNNGYLYTYFNSGGPGNAMNLTRDTDPLWLTMDVGQISTPVIYDLDGDGLMDIIVGEKTGNINFYKNTGTPTEPAFNPDETAAPNIANLGAINTQTIPNGIGHSAPQFINTSSGLLLITGTQDGHFEAYQVTGATANAYPLVDARWGGVDVGWRSTPAFADLDEDGILEMVAGNVRGGVSLFRTVLSPFTPPVNTSNLVEEVKFQLQPNPATDLTQLLISGKTGTSFEWTVYDLLGRRVTGGHTTTKSIDIATATWPKGVYVVTVSDGQHLATKKLICN